ncbi:hypothetical protein ATN84_24950 [Paramesorhizobium deserti]|uniref:Uncharacterized protein n=1 Tax=Paramesorhizobium deserti TaxID=1494590 RepID=A0A135HXH0_9HYPH|nr:hypothetical protein ATN84_24950 [Paramesorhizobium deserti]
MAFKISVDPVLFIGAEEDGFRCEFVGGSRTMINDMSQSIEFDDFLNNASQIVFACRSVCEFDNFPYAGTVPAHRHDPLVTNKQQSKFNIRDNCV